LHPLLHPLLLRMHSAGLLFIYFGHNDVGADAPHWPPPSIDRDQRDRSIAVRSADLQPLNVKDPARVLKAPDNMPRFAPAATWPWARRTRKLPAAPNLAQVRIAHNVGFWSFEHGIKMSAVPAWGAQS
jgi:hypothetical protein